MLVLARRVGESIVIGEGPQQVVVTVHRLKGKQVWLALEADKAVRIWRAELRPYSDDGDKRTSGAA